MKKNSKNKAIIGVLAVLVALAVLACGYYKFNSQKPNPPKQNLSP